MNLRQRCCDTRKSLDLLILKMKYKTAGEFPSRIITHFVSSMNCESVNKPIRYLKGIGKTSGWRWFSSKQFCQRTAYEEKCNSISQSYSTSR